MGKRTLYIALILGIFIFIQSTSCNEGQMTMDPPITDTTPCPDTVEALPPITNKGLNTAGCLRNGTVWVARADEYFGGDSNRYPDVRVKYGNLGSNPNNPLLKLYLYRIFTNECDTANSSISFASNKIVKNQKIPIANSWVYWDAFNCLDFDKIPTNEHYIIVDYLDTINQIIAGRFAFTAVNHCPTPDTVVVTDGRFDVVYEDFD